VINNTSTGTWNYTNDYPTLNAAVGGGTFNNAGTFEKTGGTATTTVYPAFTNTGKVLGNAATLSFQNLAGASSGSWSAAAGDALVLDGATTAPSLSGNLSGVGTVYFTSGTVNVIAGATFTGSGALVINGGTVLFESASAVTISQAVTLTSNGTLAGPGTVNINGLLTWGTNGSMCTVAACNAAGAGVTNANGGISYATGYVYLYGRTLNNAGTATWGTTTGYSLYLAYAAVINNTSKGTWNYINDYPTLNTTVGGGTFNNAGTFEKTGGTATTTVYPAFTNTGKVLGNAATLSIQNLAGTSSGSWSAAAGDALVLDGGTTAPSLSGNFSGAGTVYFSSGTVNVIAGATFTGSGALVINGGTVFFETGSAVTISQALTLTDNGTLAGPGTVNINGLLSWGNGGSMCTPAACNAPGTGVTNANGGISYINGEVYLYGRTLNNAGTATFGTASGYNFYLGYAAVINNTSAGTWNYTNDYPTLYTTTGGGTFNNAGTFEKTGGTTTTTLYPPYTQTAGTTFIASGSLAFGSSPMIQGGTIGGTGAIFGNYTGTVSTNPAGAIAPGTATAMGSIALSGTGSGNYTEGTGSFDVKIGGTGAGQFDTLTATGTASLLGGTLKVTLIGGFTPVVGDTFTILTAGAVSGKFAFTNLPPGYGWVVNYNPTTVVLSIGSVSTPVATLGTTSIAFPSTIVGKSSAPMTVSLENTGTVALTIASIVPMGTDRANYAYQKDATKPCPISPATLGINATCIVDVTFTPQSVGAHNSAQITITDNNGSVAGSTQAIGLTGTGIVLSSIAVTPANPSITKGATQQFTATGTYSDSSTANLTSQVTWASGTTMVATITAGGLATGAGAGTSSISATLGSVSGSTVLTVMAPTLKSIAVTPANPSITKGATQQFTATGTYSDSSTANLTSQVTWASGTTTVATITAGGLATGAGAGTSSISATLGSVSGSTVLTVTATGGEPMISITALDQGTLPGAFYVDLQVMNTGTGTAVNVNVTQLTFGSVTYNTTMSPPLPIVIGSLSAGGSTSIRLFLNFPPSVSRFSIAEDGTLQDSTGKALNFAAAQSFF
jgi:hypothetical protein